MRKSPRFAAQTKSGLVPFVSAMAAAVGFATAPALGQSNSITVDCAGASVPSTGSTPNIVRTSPEGVTIFPATGYQFSFNPIVHGTGFLGVIAIGSTPRPLGDVLNGFFIGGQRVLHGAMRNPSGTLPTVLDSETLAGTFSGLTLSLTFKQELLSNGRGQASVIDIVRPTFVGLAIDSGGAVFNTWTPPAPVVSEWQFEGGLQSVKESGAFPASGPSKMRYLDDPAFGAILGGVGAEDTLPSPATPTGVTQAQSQFGTITSFGLPPIGSGPLAGTDGVYKTSPPRNAGAPSDTAKSRGLGLSVWPNTRDFWPDERIGQWTLVADLLIPQASWDAARTAPGGAGGQVIPLVEDSQNNNSAADVFLWVDAAGNAKIGHSVAPGAAVSAPAIQPNQWFRLAISVNHYGAQSSRIFVNGAFVGASQSDWVYNACKSADPRWGDISSTNVSGTPIPGATWNGWGQFPSPWAKQADAPNAPTASTFSMFADITGAGQSVYVANAMFTDEAMSDSGVAALGGPSARGIVYLRPEPVLCAAEFDGVAGVSVADLFGFLDAWFAQFGVGPGMPSADFDHDLDVDVADLFAYLDAWFAEFGSCP